MKVRVALVFLVCAGVVRAEETPAYKRLKQIAAEMARFGMPVDVGRVRLTLREPRGGRLRVESPYGRRTAPDDDATAFVEHAWGIGAGQQTLKAWAYYAPTDRRIVFHAIGTGSLVGGDPVAAHELTHALQHQRSPDWLRLAWSPTEAINIRSCLGEGEAQLAALLLLLRRRGKTLADAHLPAIDAVRRGGLDLGGGGAPYIAGFRFAAEEAQRHGVARIVAWLKKPPTSTEQILHPQKVGRDLPTPIRFPEFPGARIQKIDCLGELELFRIWSAKGPVVPAMRASIGWDGDALRVYRTREGKVFSVWVSAWDRLVDAEQAWTIVKQRWTGDAIRNGRTVIWFCSFHTEIREQVRAACATHCVTTTFDKRAAESTADVESRWLSAFSRSKSRIGARWRLGDVPVSIHIPSGWFRSAGQLGTVLVSNQVNERFVMINVSTWPLAAFGGLDGVEKFVRRARHPLYWMKVESVERVKGAGVEALLVDRFAMWGRRVLPGRYRELYVPVGGTLVAYSVFLPMGTPKVLKRGVDQALRGFRLDSD